MLEEDDRVLVAHRGLEQSLRVGRRRRRNDDLTLRDLEIEAHNAIPASKKRLVTIGGSTHMTLYSDRSLLTRAGIAAAESFSEQLGDVRRVGTA